MSCFEGCFGGAAQGSQQAVDRAEKISRAFVFVKPHAVTDHVGRHVKKTFEEKGIKILKEGRIASETIDNKGLIDTHYGSIAARCVSQKPATLVVQQKGKDEFKKVFGASWDDALQQGLIYNGADGAKKLGLDTMAMAIKFDTLKKGVDQVKLGGGFYCGRMDGIYIINGFYYRMRAVFTEPGKSIHYFVVEWETAKMSWGDFRGKILGATNPVEAAVGSLRSFILKEFKALGLAEKPDMGNNGMHASASPFEALAECNNWLQEPLTGDYFAQAMLFKGVPLKTIKDWCSDPNVKFQGKSTSLFDAFEDVDGKEVLEKSVQIVKEN